MTRRETPFPLAGEVEFRDVAPRVTVFQRSDGAHTLTRATACAVFSAAPANGRGAVLR